ncbi:MAG: leucine-rich repeat domain-containing protein [Muribaculaceae bacterium]|nr:leucine-rich repeat domain-containing protein [Muribaculaceae bacterium]
MKQFIAALICLISTVAASAQTSHFEIGGIHYWIEGYTDGTVSVGNSEGCWREYLIDQFDCTPWCTEGGDYAGTLTIPSTVTHNGTEYTVNRIAPAAFVNCTELIEVNMPATIESIGIGAFYNCSKLTTVNFPEKVRGVRAEDFYGCNSLAKLDLSKVRDFVELRMDYVPNLKHVILPSNAIYYKIQDYSKEKTDRYFYIANPEPPFVFGTINGFSEGTTLYSPYPTDYGYSALWGRVGGTGSDGFPTHKPLDSAGLDEIVAAPAPAFTVVGNAVTAPAESRLEVYDTQGRLSAIIPAGCTGTLTGGIYMIRCGFASEKIVIK